MLLVASLAGPVSAADPGDARWRSVLGSIEASIPSKPIKSVAIAPHKETQGGDAVSNFADGTARRFEAQGYAQSAPDGQTFGFNLIEYYTVGLAFRDGGKSIAVSAQGTHGPTYLGLYDVATWTRVGTSDGNPD